MSSLQQVGLFADDAGPQRLELEPSGHVRSDLLVCDRRAGRINFYGSAYSFCQELGLTTSFHGDEPPGGFVDGLAYGQQAVVAQDRCFLCAQGLGDALAFGTFKHDAGEIREYRVILVEGAGILRDGIEQASE